MDEMNTNHTTPSTDDIDALIQLLDGYVADGGSRLKLNVVEGEGKVVNRQYHHGRCDVGSPWAKGQAFDVLEDEKNPPCG